jgi:hypothetical protein
VPARMVGIPSLRALARAGPGDEPAEGHCGLRGIADALGDGSVQRMGVYAALADRSVWLACGWKRCPDPEPKAPL